MQDSPDTYKYLLYVCVYVYVVLISHTFKSIFYWLWFPQYPSSNYFEPFFFFAGVLYIFFISHSRVLWVMGKDFLLICYLFLIMKKYTKSMTPFWYTARFFFLRIFFFLVPHFYWDRHLGAEVVYILIRWKEICIKDLFWKKLFKNSLVHMSA